MSDVQPKILRLPARLYKLAGGVLSFPERYRHQNHRITQLEQALAESQLEDMPTTKELERSQNELGSQLEALKAHMPTTKELERSQNELGSQLEALKAHMPTILGTMTSAASSSRQLARKQNELHEALTDNVKQLWDRIEFVRNEILFEASLGKDVGVEEKQIEARVINHEKLDAMGDDIKVNMGCGHAAEDDYLNLDMRELPHVDVVASVADMPFAEGQVGELFSSHLLEHFPQEELRRQLLPYWFSLLKPGGLLRAVLPDWEAMLNSFAVGSYSFDDLRVVTFGGQEYKGNFHFNMFTPDSLRAALQGAGFREVSFPVTGERNDKCFEMEVKAVK